MKLFFKTCLTTIGIFICSLIIAACHNSSNEKKIGVIVPLENKALDEIVAGFTEKLRHEFPAGIKIKIANAQGDMNLQRAIISQMKSEHYDLIAPIGTAATQMSLAMTKQQPIVSLAANYLQEDRAKLEACHLAVVHDEISPRQIVAFIHAVYPDIKQLTLIHSGTEKIYADVKVAIAAGKAFGINIKPKMSPTLNDLYSVANSIPQDSQGILILKDILIASGVNTLARTAERLHIPLIAADQGSVQEGAAFALGVYEKNIGIEGGKLAAKILAGKEACELNIVDMKTLTVFVNKNNLQKENQSVTAIESAAEKNKYTIAFTDKKNEAS